jgi:hypothetical protein
MPMPILARRLPRLGGRGGEGGGKTHANAGVFSSTLNPEYQVYASRSERASPSLPPQAYGVVAHFCQTGVKFTRRPLARSVASPPSVPPEYVPSARFAPTRPAPIRMLRRGTSPEAGTHADHTSPVSGFVSNVSSKTLSLSFSLPIVIFAA